MAAKKSTAKIGGRTVAAWKNEIMTALPNATNEEIAAAFNEKAEHEGYDYRIDAEKVATWKNGKKGKKRKVEMGEDGNIIPALRVLCAMVGKDAVKAIVDSL